MNLKGGSKRCLLKLDKRGYIMRCQYFSILSNGILTQKPNLCAEFYGSASGREVWPLFNFFSDEYALELLPTIRLSSFNQIEEIFIAYNNPLELNYFVYLMG